MNQPSYSRKRHPWRAAQAGVCLLSALLVLGAGCKRRAPAAKKAPDRTPATVASEVQPASAPAERTDSPSSNAAPDDWMAVRTYELRIKPGDLAAVETGRMGNDTVPAVFISGGQQYTGVGLRVRGSWARTWPKKALKIVFDKNNRFEGHHAVNLNSGWRDAAFVREPLAYYIYRRSGVPAPESHLVRLMANGQLHGLYVEVEQPEKPLLKRSGLKGAILYKAFATHADERDLGSLNAFATGYERASDKELGLADLQKFCHELHAAASAEDFFNRNVDVDRYINYLAASALVQQWDGLNKNHYLAEDADGSGKWFVMPWDLDRTFGDWWDQSFSHYDSPLFLGVQQQPGITGWNRMEDRFFKVPAFRARYLKRLSELLDQEFTPEKLNPILDQWESAIAQDAAADRQLWPSPAGSLHSGIQGLKRYIVRRREFLRQEIAKLQ